MRNRMGVTEPVWSSLSEDRKFIWKCFCRAVVIVGIFFVYKTGNVYFDWTLGLFTAAFMLLVVETQRAYSKFSPLYRKRATRIAFVLGSWGVSVLGAAYFLQAGLMSAAAVFVKDVAPLMGAKVHPFTQGVMLLCFVVAIPVACFRVFRQLQVKALVYDLPRELLKKLLVQRQPASTSFLAFAHIELGVLFACLIYSSAVGVIAKQFMTLWV